MEKSGILGTHIFFIQKVTESTRLTYPLGVRFKYSTLDYFILDTSFKHVKSYQFILAHDLELLFFFLNVSRIHRQIYIAVELFIALQTRIETLN